MDEAFFGAYANDLPAETIIADVDNDTADRGVGADLRALAEKRREERRPELRSDGDNSRLEQLGRADLGRGESWESISSCPASPGRSLPNGIPRDGEAHQGEVRWGDAPLSGAQGDGEDPFRRGPAELGSRRGPSWRVP